MEGEEVEAIQPPSRLLEKN